MKLRQRQNSVFVINFRNFNLNFIKFRRKSKKRQACKINFTGLIIINTAKKTMRETYERQGKKIHEKTIFVQIAQIYSKNFYNLHQLIYIQFILDFYTPGRLCRQLPLRGSCQINVNINLFFFKSRDSYKSYFFPLICVQSAVLGIERMGAYFYVVI